MSRRALRAEFARSTRIPHLEARRSCQENSCYRAHTHETFSLGLIDAGTSVLAGPLGGRVRLRPGDVVVIPAGQVHQCNPEGGRWLYQMIHLDQRWASGLSRHAEADRLFAGVAVLRRPDLQGMVSAWGELIFADETAELLRSRFRGLLEVLGDVTPEHRQVGEAEPELRQMLSPVLERLRDDESNPSLDELAAMVGMGRYQLVRAVKRATGLTPLAWRQNARIGRARRMLRDGLPIAETAVALGFTDQSHFHRVFRAHVAASPGTYRA